MGVEFHLVDLVSQSAAVQHLLLGKNQEAKVAWLAAHGTVNRIEHLDPELPPHFRFESGVGRTCVFFLQGDTFCFLGDHHVFTARDVDPT